MWPARIHAPDGTLAIKSLYYPFVGGAIAVGAGIYGAVTMANDPVLGTGFAVVWALLAGVFSARMWRVALIEQGDALLVRNVFSTRRIPWTDIASISVVRLPGNGHTVAVGFRRTGNRWRRTSSATMSYSRAHVAAISYALTERSARWRVPCDLNPDELRCRVFG
jgi:Bacterial PH domain